MCRRTFHIFSYLMVFQNTVVGVTSAFIRILYSIFFGLLLIFRLDRVVLMKGFERFDKGHRSYVGFLYLEHTLNNPVLNCFVEQLLEGRRRRALAEARVDHGDNTAPLALTLQEKWIDGSGESPPCAHFWRVRTYVARKWKCSIVQDGNYF